MRKNMDKKLRNAPVYYTLAQVQFNPILNVGNFINIIQSRLREADFPDYKEEAFQRIILPFSGIESAQAAPPILSHQIRYSFGNISGRTSFLLETNALTLQTTEYQSFKEFMRIFLVGLAVVNDALRLAFIERVGLRYLDAVYPMGDEDSLDIYLVPEVAGIYKKLSGTLIHSASETMALTSAGQLVSRVIIRNGTIGLPDEVTSHSLFIDPRFTQWDGLHAIVDTDAFDLKRKAFEMDSVKSQLADLHDVVKQSFKSTVTDYAWTMWT